MKRQTKVTEIKKSEEGEEEAMKGQKGLTRREMLKLSAAVGAGSLLVACGPTVTSTVASTLVPPTVAATASVPPTVAPTAVLPTSAPAVAPAAQGSQYEVLPPYGVPTIKVLQPVKRLDTLDGKTIGGMGAAFHFPETWITMVEVLKKKYPTATFINPDQIPSSKMADQAGVVDPEAIAADVKKFKLDAVIVGNGC